MDPLEITYDTLEAVPEAFRPLYAENDGKFVLTGINGMKTEADTIALTEALRKERADHSAARDLLKPWKDLKHDEVQAQLDRIPELELASKGKLDDEQINQMVEGRLGQKTGPLQRQLEAMTTDLAAMTGERDSLRTSIERRDMNDIIRAVSTEMKVIATAIPDVEMVAAAYLEKDPTTGKWITKADVQGVTPGVDVKQFMKEMQKMRPHWWPASAGGGAGGGGNNFGGQANPWTNENWNMTTQGAVLREQGREVADRMAKAAGTIVGGMRPAK
jgi:hypothetical protein